MRSEATMTRDVIVVPPELDLAVAEELMHRRRIRHLPVVRDGRLIGVLSDRDLLRSEALLAQGLEHSAAVAMTPAPITCSPATPVSRVAAIMLDHKIDCVPIVEDSRLVGLVTSSDLLQLLVNQGGLELLPFEFQLRLREEDGLAAEA